VSSAAASLADLLAERTRRIEARVRADAERAAKEREAAGDSEAARLKSELVASQLRGILANHPKQQAFCRSRAKRKIGICTRRAGKSSGENREELARAITEPDFRCTYCNQTRYEAKGIVWRGDTGDGWLDLIGKHGELTKQPGVYRLGGVLAKVNETELSIDFSNGSRLDVFAADDERSINKMRGKAKTKIRVDEAGKFRFLKRFINEVADPALRDFDGELVLTGTPTDEMEDSYFYDASKDPNDGDGDPIGGWEVHRWSVVDNPAFGSTEEERWSRTAGHALKMNGWTGEEPAFLREWLGKWVASDMRMVYAVNAVPDSTLIYAPMRTLENGWHDHAAAMKDLPQKQGSRRINWLMAIGCDFAYWPDSFALVLWAFSLDHTDIYEMFTYKAKKLDADSQRDHIMQLYQDVDDVVVLVGDPGGAMTQAAMAGWRERLSLPIEDADKAGKHTWIENMNADIRRGRVHFRSGSPLLHEMRHLMWLPTKTGKPKEHDNRVLSDGSVPGRDACDASLYSYRHLSHWMAKPAADEPPPGSVPALELEAKKHADHLEDLAKQRAADMAYGDEWSF
jgi:hypothetical protein